MDEKINDTYKYSPKVIEQGLFWNSSLKTGLFLYGEGDNQKIANFSTGPELTLGSFTNNFLDFTNLNLQGFFLKVEKVHLLLTM